MLFNEYKKKGSLIEIVSLQTFLIGGGCLAGVSISDVDLALPAKDFYRGMIARNPKNHKDMWFLNEEYFNEHYVLNSGTKTLENTTANTATKNVSDIKFWGNGDTFELICKAYSKNEGWMKSTKAMEIPGVGCVIQVSTQQGDNVAEAVTFVPNTTIARTLSEEGEVINRQIVYNAN